MRKRFKPIKILLAVMLIWPALILVCHAEEQITITTYYPAPNGIYREMRVDQMSVGSAYRASAVANGNIIISGGVSIGSSGAPSGKLVAVMPNGTSRVIINNDNNAGIELRGVGGTPYIDLSNDATIDYDFRIILTENDELGIRGGRTTFSNDSGTPATIRVGEVWFCAGY